MMMMIEGGRRRRGKRGTEAESLTRENMKEGEEELVEIELKEKGTRGRVPPLPYGWSS
jgi:hypothetical protein